MSKPTVYIETTIPSYLTARPTSDVVALARQVETIDWWENYRHDFELITSDLVIFEASQGNVEASKRRLDLLQDLPKLSMPLSAEKLAEYLLQKHALPKKAELDSQHVAISAVHQIDYLLTWNCKHIVNATMRDKIDLSCKAMGFTAPKLCTPAELIDLT